jgi:hypothetical protein
MHTESVGSSVPSGPIRHVLIERRWATIATSLAWGAIALLAAAWLSATVAPAYALFRWIPNGYNEGWNAYWAQVAWKGGPLYPAVDSPVSNNYPPVSFYIVGGLGRLLGDNIFAGRLLALVSLIVIALALFAWLRINSVSRAVAAFGAVLFLAAFAQYAPAYIAMNDPQLLAHAFVMTSVVLMWRYKFSRNALVTAAVLMIVAGLVKHLLIALIQVNSARGDPRLSWRLPQACNEAIARVYSQVTAPSQSRLMRPGGE